MPHTIQPQTNHGGFEPRQTSTPVKTFMADTASTIGRIAMDISKLALFPVCCAALCKLLREAGIAVEAVQWVESTARAIDWMSVYSDYIVPFVLLIAMTSFIFCA